MFCHSVSVSLCSVAAMSDLSYCLVVEPVVDLKLDPYVKIRVNRDP
jgi:hypothetical protein